MRKLFSIPSKAVFSRSAAFMLLIVFCGLLAAPASAQWVQTNGPYGGSVFALAASGTNLYAYVFDNPVNLTDPFGLSGWLRIYSSGTLRTEFLPVKDVLITRCKPCHGT